MRWLSVLITLILVGSVQAQRPLKQSTAVVISVGILVDATDGTSPETTATVGNITCYAHKADGTDTALTLTASGGSNDFVHVQTGTWDLELTATDTSVLGPLRVTLVDSTPDFVPIWEDFVVLPANVYDSMYGSDKLQTDATQVEGGDATDALDAATPAVTLAAGAITNASLGGNLEVVFETDFATAYNTTTDAWETNLTDVIGTLDAAEFGTNAITSTVLAGDCITSAQIAASAINDGKIANGAITAAKLATDCITSDELSSTALANINTEVDNAIVTYGLDHLASTSVTGTDIADDSVLAYLVSSQATADWDDFVNTSDALQALADSGSGNVLTIEGVDATDAIDARLAAYDAVVPADLPANFGDLNITATTGLVRADLDNSSGTLADAQMDDDVLGGTPMTPAEVEAEVEDALQAMHLDHLLAVEYDPASKPGVATALFNELIESDAGVSRYTANSLAEAPTGGSAPTVSEIRAEIDSNSTKLASIETDTQDLQSQIGSAGAGLTGLPDVTTDAASRTASKATGFATPTNITAGTITTVTNLTNAPTAGDLTATMKASINTEADTALADYDGPTNSEMVNRTLAAAGYFVAATDGVILADSASHGGASAAITLADYSDFSGAGLQNPNVLLSSEIDSVPSTTTYLLAAGASTVDDAYNDQALVVYDNGNSDFPCTRTVVDYDGATRVVTINAAANFTVDATDSVKIFVQAPGATPPTAAAIVDEWESQSVADPTNFRVNVYEVVGTEQTGNDNGADINLILEDTNELQVSGTDTASTLLTAEIGTYVSQTEFELSTGSDVDDTYNGQTVICYDDTNSDYPSVRTVSDYTGSTKLLTLDSAPDFTIGADDSVAIIAGSSLDAAEVRSAVGMASADLDTQLNAIVADTNELQTDWVNSGRLDTLLDTAAAGGGVSVADIWNATLATYSGTSGSVAEALSNASSAGDPWDTALPGSYTTGKAGYLVGNGMTPISTIAVADTRTFKAFRNTNKAPNVISLSTDDDVTLAMDMTDVLNPGTSIASVSSVTEVTSTSVTIDNTTVSADKLKAHFDVTDFTVDTTVQLAIKVVTTDGDTVTIYGYIEVD